MRLLRATAGLLAAAAAGCFGVDMGGSNVFTCSKDSDCLSGKTCSAEGFCVAAGSDAGGDAGGDTGADGGDDGGDGGCTPEPETAFCTRLGKNCDNVTAPDNCGTSRTVNCGACSGTGESCGGGPAGTPNVCGCTPNSDAQLCAGAASCGPQHKVDNCGTARDVDCGCPARSQVCGANGQDGVCNVPTTCSGVPAGKPSGVYVLSTIGAEAYCDMVTDGGGWMLVHTKVTRDFLPWSSNLDTACLKSGANDCASRVPADLPWTEALWRFQDNTAIWVKWAKAYHPQFADYLNGTGTSANGIPVNGFTRNVNGTATGPAQIDSFWFSNFYVSELFNGGTGQWLNLWNSQDTACGGYTSVEDVTLCGMKCLAGYCRAAPVWLMVR
jgi:hypothetical protein